MDNEFVLFSIFGFKISINLPEFLSCKKILENIKNDIKKEQEQKFEVIENKFDDNSI